MEHQKQLVNIAKSKCELLGMNLAIFLLPMVFEEKGASAHMWPLISAFKVQTLSSIQAPLDLKQSPRHRMFGLRIRL